MLKGIAAAVVIVSACASVSVAQPAHAPLPSWNDTASTKAIYGLSRAAVYFDQARTWHVATTATVNVHSTKRGSDTRVGNILNLEGGLGHDMMQGGLTAGPAYYATFKLTEDELGPVAAALVRGRNRVLGLGPEVTLALAAKNSICGFATARYQWEVGARVAPEGRAFNILATFLLKPVKLKQRWRIPCRRRGEARTSSESERRRGRQ